MPRFKTGLAVLVPALFVLTISCGPKRDEPVETAKPAAEPAAAAAPAAQPATARAELKGPDGTSHGTVTFSEENGAVEIVADLSGLPPGSHGFHLHEGTECTPPDFKSAGGHFNPTNAPHGGPTDAEHHAGDSGNIEIDASGNGHLELSTSLLTVAPGPNSAVGHAVIVHEKADDLKTQPSGDAGARIACGIVVAEGAATAGQQ